MNIGHFQRRDENERQIIDGLRASGVYVRQMHSSAGFDLLCAYDGKIYLMEVKRPKCALTDAEKIVRNEIQARGCDYHVITSLGQAIEIIWR